MAQLAVELFSVDGGASLGLWPRLWQECEMTQSSFLDWWPISVLSHSPAIITKSPLLAAIVIFTSSISYSSYRLSGSSRHLCPCGRDLGKPQGNAHFPGDNTANSKQLFMFRWRQTASEGLDLRKMHIIFQQRCLLAPTTHYELH